MPQEYFDPKNKSTHPPDSIFDPAGNLRTVNRSQPDPNSWWSQAPRTPPYAGPNITVDVGPRAGSAIDRYYDRLIEMMPNSRQSAMGDLSNVLGAFSSGEKANRVVQGNFQGDFDRMMLDREATRNQLGLDASTNFDRTSLLAAADKRDSNSDALQKLQLASYLQGGGNASTPGGAHRAVSDTERQAAGSLSTQMMDQLNRPAFTPTKFTPDFSYQPMDPSKYAKPGMLEKLTSYGGAITGGLGVLDKLTAGKSGDFLSGLLGKIPGVGNFFGNASSASPGIAGGSFNFGGGAPGVSNLLGKAVPFAGAITGGIGLMKDRGVIGNLMNGVQTGASIGSIVPGLGTAVGAGVGALVGGLRSLGGGPSQQELAGRDMHSQATQAIATMASPQQVSEAQQAGWKNPQDALSLIVVRDKLAQSGQSPELANQLISQLHSATKQGPEAVQGALMQIMQLTSRV